MAQPARRVAPPADPLPVDPSAVNQAYRLHRARRRAKQRHRREAAAARLRFYVMVLTLVALTIVFVVFTWREIQRLFGL
jgi:hypothetical protein